MIIDCHGHYTTTPPSHRDFHEALLTHGTAATPLHISDDAIRESVEANQLRLMRERGLDLMLFSPRAAGMAHHVADPDVAVTWARECNDLVYRAVELFPDRFTPVCQLPQWPNSPLGAAVEELERCVGELGFVGCNLNPDPSGGHWTSQPMTDPYWYPLYEKLVELDVPAMIHVSASCNPNAHALGAHYLNADTSVFMQLVLGDLFGRFPALRFVIPHGGGAVPYHWGRYRGLAERLGRPPIEDHVLPNVWFDTCVYHQAGVDLLCGVVDVDHILFASELLGAVRGADPETGTPWDDTKQYVDRVGLDADARGKIFEANARRVYPRLDARLRKAGR